MDLIVFSEVGDEDSSKELTKSASTPHADLKTEQRPKSKTGQKNQTSKQPIKSQDESKFTSAVLLKLR